MKLTRMHAFLIICFSAILSVLIFFIFPVWACSLALFIGIIAITYMLNDYFEERGSKHEPMEAEIIDLEPAPVPDESYTRWDAGSAQRTPSEQIYYQREPISRRLAIPLYMDTFEIDEARAKNLYGAGFYNFHMLRFADTQELVKVKGINPTIARRIKMISAEITIPKM